MENFSWPVIVNKYLKLYKGSTDYYKILKEKYNNFKITIISIQFKFD